MVFRDLSLISTLLTPLGLPSFGTKFTLTTGEDPGSSSLVENQGLLPKCEYFRLVLQRFGSISDIILSTELECSVKSYNDAIFRTCSSIAQGNIKFQLFIERVAQMFTGPDLFPDPDSLIPQPGGDDLHEAIPPATGGRGGLTWQAN